MGQPWSEAGVLLRSATLAQSLIPTAVTSWSRGLSCREWYPDGPIPEDLLGSELATSLSLLSKLSSEWRVGNQGVTYHQPVLLIGGQVFVREQSGSLQDSDDALHVACQCEAVMGQDQQLRGWVGEAVVRQDCEPGQEGEEAYTASLSAEGSPPVL